MRLRYLRLPRCGPLVDVEIVFGQEDMLFGPGEPGKRKGAINFIVGVNGTGKSSLLRALYQTFRALRAQELPPFPVTVAWDWGEGEEAATAVFSYSGSSKQRTFFSIFINQLPPEQVAHDWQTIVDKLAEEAENSESFSPRHTASVSGEGAVKASILQAHLPKKVVAYTSGAETLWENIEHPLYRPYADEEAQNILEVERPPGWNSSLEKTVSSYGEGGLPSNALEEIGMRTTRADTAFKPRLDNREPCFRVRSSDLRIAAVALALWQTAKELRGKNAEIDREGLRQQWLDRQAEGVASEDARRMFNQLDWFWPTHLSFSYHYNEDQVYPEQQAQLLCLLALADGVTLQPLNHHRAVISLGPIESLDLEAKLKEVMPYGITSDSLKAISDRVGGNNTTGAEAVMRVFSDNKNLDTMLVEVFEALRDWQACGLLEDITLTIKRLNRTVAADGEPDDVLVTFDQLSDGEQMLLGRMALLYLLRGQQGALLLLDEPETHFNDVWKREIIDWVDGAILKDTAAQVIVATHTSIALTDVFASEILRLVRRDGHTEASAPAFPTFGADPGRILLHVFGSPDVIGSRAAEFLREKLKQEWTQAKREELERLVEEIGSGWPRAKLAEILGQLDAASDS